MTTPVIIDAFAAILMAGFAIYGARRGLLRSLAGLVIVAVALVGAGMVAATFSAPAAKLAAPLVTQRISERVEEAMAVQAGAGHWEAEALPELLDLLGIDGELRKTLTGQIGASLEESGGEAVEAVTAAVVEGLARSMLYGILYILSFLALLLLLKALLKAMDLVTRLPGIHGLNALGGGLLGLIEGALVLFLAVWVARRLGLSFETPPWEDTRILRIFTDHTPLSVLAFLQ